MFNCIFLKKRDCNFGNYKLQLGYIYAIIKRHNKVMYQEMKEKMEKLKVLQSLNAFSRNKLLKIECGDSGMFKHDEKDAHYVHNLPWSKTK